MIKRLVLAVLAVCLACATMPAQASIVTAPGNGRFNVKVKSVTQLRYKNVVRQAHDLSCGAAALATLFKYFYGATTDEKQIIESIFEFGDKARIQKDGFSMLELKKYGERRGYVAQGFKVTDPKKIVQLKIPVLTLINTRGYDHFVVIKGVKGNQVFIADPAFGNSSKPLDKFVDGWSKVILVFLSATNGGDNAFQLNPTLKAPRNDVMLLIDRTLHTVRPGADEF